MTTQINVTITGDGIVGQSRQNQEANRDSLRRREDEAVTIRGAKRGIVTVNGQQIAAAGQPKSKRPGFAREKPAAYRSGRRRFAHAAITYRFNYPTSYWRIYCGNFSTYLQDQYAFSPLADSVPTGDFYLEYIHFPISGDRCLIVVMGRPREEYYNENTNTAGFRSRAYISKAYIVTEFTVRETIITDSLQSLLDILNPPSQAEDQVEFEPDGVNTSPFPPRFIYNAADGYVGYFIHEFTAQIYELCNLIVPFAQSNLIKQFPAEKLPVTPDWRFGYYADNPSDKSLYYAFWLGNKNASDQDVRDSPNLCIALPESTVQLPLDFVVPWVADTDYQYKCWTFSWDWDDPAYCRTMLNALGFTDADLAP